MKSYNAGMFRNKCQICSEVITINDNGFEIKDNVVKYNLKCFVAPITTTEYFGADRNGTTIKTTVVTRKKNDVTTVDCLMLDGYKFNILNITREPSSQYMELLIERR